MILFQERLYWLWKRNQPWFMLSLTADKTKCQKLKNSRSRHPSHDPNPRYFREPRDLKWPHSNWFGVISMIGTMRLVRWPGRKFLNQKKNSKIYPHILIFGQDILIHSRKQLVFWRVPLSIRACPYWAHVSGSPNCHEIQSVLCAGGSSTFFTVSLLGTFFICKWKHTRDTSEWTQGQIGRGNQCSIRQ